MTEPNVSSKGKEATPDDQKYNFDLAEESTEPWDVLIVGSGLSGLTAAYRILLANNKLRVLIVDALNYFGGRTRSIELSDYCAYESEVSIGGTFTLFQHDDTLSLAREINCYPGDSLDISTINFSQFSKDLLNPAGLPLFLYLLSKGAKIVDSQKQEVKWNCKTAQKLDKLSLEEWIKNQKFLSLISDTNFTREYFYILENFPNLDNVSALQCAVDAYIRFRGIPLNGFEIPPQVRLWEGGTGVFTHALVKKLEEFPNFCIRLNARVENISQPDLSGKYPATVTIRTASGSPTVVQPKAKFVIMAISPKASAPIPHGGTIDYQPPLGPAAEKLFSRIDPTPTVATNILVVYEKPWWVEAKVGSFILPPYCSHVGQEGVWGNLVNATMKGEGKPGVLRIFCDTTRIPNWTKDQIVASTRIFLTKMFPDHQDLALSYKDVIIYDWTTKEPTVPGVTYTFAPTGILSSCGHAFTTPHGCIHWAGSERAYWGVNWMEGAVERGNTTAQEVLRDSGWVSKTYTVRPAKKRLMAFTTTARLGSPEAPTPVTTGGLVDLACELQPDPQNPISLDELMQYHRCDDEQRLQAQGRFTPQQCLSALHKLQQFKEAKKLEKEKMKEKVLPVDEAAAAPTHQVTRLRAMATKPQAVPQASSSSSSSSSYVLPQELHEETPLPPGVSAKDTRQLPQTLPTTSLVSPEAYRAIALPTFLTGLALGIAATVLISRLRTQP